MTLAIIDARDSKYVVVSAGAALAGSLVEQARLSALAAVASAAEAEISAAYAESMTGPTYASTAAGLAATASGNFFAVDNGDGTVSIYLDSAGTAVLQRTLLTTAAASGSGGSALIGFKQAGLGALAQPVQTRLRGATRATDFGVIADGTIHTVAEWIIPGALGRFANLTALQVEYPHVTSTTDPIDWAGLQAAINSRSTRGGCVRMPTGSLMLGGKLITWPIGKPIYLIGDGMPAQGNGTDHTGATELVTTRLGTCLSVVGTGFDSAQMGGAMRDFSIKGPGLGTASTLIDLTWASASSGNFTFKDLYLYNCGTGLRFDATLSLSLWNVTARGCTTGYNFNPSVEACNTVRLFGCNAISCDTGALIQNSSNLIAFYGGTFEGTGIGIYVLGDANAPSNIIVDGVWFESDTAGSRGILVFTNPVNPKPVNIVVTKCIFTSQLIAIELNRGDNIIIEYNRFVNMTGAKVPVRVDADATNVQIILNKNDAGNNDYNIAGAGTGLVIVDYVGDIRRTRYGKDGATHLVYPNGEHQFTSHGAISPSRLGQTVGLPTYTTTQRDALTGIANGDMIYNATTSKIQGRAGGAWVDLH